MEDDFSHAPHFLAAHSSLRSTRPSELSLLYFGMLVSVVLVQLRLRQSWWWDFVGVASDIIGDTIWQQISWPSGSHNLSISASAMFPEPYVRECFVNVSIRTRLHNSLFLLVVVCVCVCVCFTSHLEIGSCGSLFLMPRWSSSFWEFSCPCLHFATEALLLLMHTAVSGIMWIWGSLTQVLMLVWHVYLSIDPSLALHIYL